LDERLALVLHPVRMRLVHAMRSAGSLTTRELCARLADLPTATVYRHVERLARGGVFEVESERRVRGAVERRYRLVPAAAAVSADDARTMTLEDHRQTFTAAMTALIADFGAYLDRAGADPSADKVSYRQSVAWLSPEERSQLIDTLGQLLRTLARRAPDRQRAPHTFSAVFFPISSGDQQAPQEAPPP
jgi:predicted ArsR family transcriptional regulator